MPRDTPDDRAPILDEFAAWATEVATMCPLHKLRDMNQQVSATFTSIVQAFRDPDSIDVIRSYIAKERAGLRFDAVAGGGQGAAAQALLGIAKRNPLPSVEEHERNQRTADDKIGQYLRDQEALIEKMGQQAERLAGVGIVAEQVLAAKDALMAVLADVRTHQNRLDTAIAKWASSASPEPERTGSLH